MVSPKGTDDIHHCLCGTRLRGSDFDKAVLPPPTTPLIITRAPSELSPGTQRIIYLAKYERLLVVSDALARQCFIETGKSNKGNHRGHNNPSSLSYFPEFLSSLFLSPGLGRTSEKN